MKLTEIRWVLVALAVIGLAGTFVSHSEPATLGVSAQWANGEYHISGGTSPLFLSIALLVLLCYWVVLWATDPPVQGKPLPGVLRRFLAFWIDFTAAMFCIGPLVGIIPVVSEYARTGTFAWQFERDVPKAGDVLLTSGSVALCFVGLLFYFSLPLLRRKPSLGACIMGYLVVPDEGTRPSLRRILLRSALGFIAVCAAYIAPFIGRERKSGKFWLDKVFSTHAITIQ